MIETYQKHKQIYDDFCHKMAIDKRKLDVINQKLSALENEHKRIAGLNKVDNVFTTLQVTVCPTCKQTLPIGEEIRGKELEKAQLIELDKMITNKKKFLKVLKETTENNLQQKQLHLLYIEKLLSQDKTLVEQLHNESYFSSSGISEIEIMEVAKLKLELEQTRVLQSKIEASHRRLENIKEEFEEHDKAYKSLNDNERMGIENSLAKFEIIFKEYLMSYEYKSNYRNQIYLELNRSSSYLYFPLGGV